MSREETFKGEEQEFLFVWCREEEKKNHRDYYIFGHRHLVLDLPVGSNSRYLNIGEWVHLKAPYGEYDGQQVVLKNFEA